jgi:transposase
MKSQNLKTARAAKAVIKANKPPRKRPIRITKKKFLKALAGTGGIKQRIAERLGTSQVTVRNILRRPDWLDVRIAFEEETERLVDAAESRIVREIEHGDDAAVATANARWFLSRKGKHRGYGDETKTIVEGGDKPINVDVRQLSIVTIEDLRAMPIDARRALLARLEQKALQQEGDQGAGPASHQP